jgi:hypothetical protein
MDEVAWIDDTELTKQILNRVDPKLGPELLHLILQKDCLDLAQKLADDGVSVDAKLDGETLLYAAVYTVKKFVTFDSYASFGCFKTTASVVANITTTTITTTCNKSSSIPYCIVCKKEKKIKKKR